ncbi:MAG: 3-deoxy-D-manno-octulosonic-acid transferase [Flavobacteriales bacterium]|jgi:3-deoxy-D-manno-octulosonic-acid transferase
MKLLYYLAIALFGLAARLAALKSPKAKAFVEGRRGTLSHLRETRSKSQKVFWMHCASLGEFEQGRSVLEAFAQSHPDYDIYLTFFSPSGYEIRKDYDKAAWVGYLPLDLPGKVDDFLEALRPNIVVVVKYEIWPTLFSALNQRSIPLIMISAIFREEQRHFKWYGGIFRKALQSAAKIYVQNEESAKLLKTIGIDSVEVAGDTRFDRVCQIAERSKSVPLIKEFKGDKTLVILGSSWQPDEKLLAAYDATSANDQCKIIIAPHEIGEAHIEEIEQLWSTEILRYSKATAGSITDARVLLIDNIGLLSRLYGHADFAIIGGGFGAGIHNILEAAAFGVSVIIGPKYKKFQEAVELAEIGGALVINDQNEFDGAMKNLLDLASRNKRSKLAKEYCLGKSGATEQIVLGVELLLKE